MSSPKIQRGTSSFTERKTYNFEIMSKIKSIQVFNKLLNSFNLSVASEQL